MVPIADATRQRWRIFGAPLRRSMPWKNLLSSSFTSALDFADRTSIAGSAGLESWPLSWRTSDRTHRLAMADIGAALPSCWAVSRHL